MGDLFSKIKVNTLKYKTSELPEKPSKNYILPALTAGIQNQGLNNYVPVENATILKNVISISANGANTGATFYQSKEFTILQDSYAIEWKYNEMNLTDNEYLFLVGAITKTIVGNYEWTHKAGWERIKGDKIQLPIKNGNIDFDFMESFVAELETRRVAELEAYLSVTGLKDYTLTEEEKTAYRRYKSGNINFKGYTFETIFNNIQQGRRLKKDDQLAGNIPFVMAGVTNTGVANYISNQIAKFPANSITVDIFGNTFYRNYTFGAGDDTGVYWNDSVNYEKECMLYFATVMAKAIAGKYSYGKKLRSSQSLQFQMLLPTKDEKPDFVFMKNFISAIQKLVIKDVVLYADKKLEATKAVIGHS